MEQLNVISEILGGGTSELIKIVVFLIAVLSGIILLLFMVSRLITLADIKVQGKLGYSVKRKNLNNQKFFIVISVGLVISVTLAVYMFLNVSASISSKIVALEKEANEERAKYERFVDDLPLINITEIQLPLIDNASMKDTLSPAMEQFIRDIDTEWTTVIIEFMENTSFYGEYGGTVVERNEKANLIRVGQKELDKVLSDAIERIDNYSLENYIQSDSNEYTTLRNMKYVSSNRRILLNEIFETYSEQYVNENASASEQENTSKLITVYLDKLNEYEREWEYIKSSHNIMNENSEKEIEAITEKIKEKKRSDLQISR